MAQLILTEQEEAAHLWSDLDDAALGALLRKKLVMLHSAAEQMDRTITTAAGLLLCCAAAEAGASQMSLDLDGVTQSGRDFGDWEIQAMRKQPGGQSHPDDSEADRFNTEVKAKLAVSRAKGRAGWQTASPADLSRLLREQVDKGDPLDVAIYAMFLWSLGHRIEPAAPKAREVGRLDDMHSKGNLRVGLDADQDVYVTVFDGASVAGLEFCDRGQQGASPRTRQALIDLMVAMEADNAARPDKDWWALRRRDKMPNSSGAG